MNPAIASLLALLLAIVLSMFSRINVGLVAIALAWITGVYIAGLKPEAVISGFPSVLFLTLTGVTLLFACADSNGTLKNLAQRSVSLVRGNRRLLPVLFFLLAFIVATVGPGAISSVALVVPLAMAIGLRAGVSPLLTALMVANGANAGNLSPVSAVGVIANTRMTEAGIGGHEGKVWFSNFVAHALVSLVAYLLFGRKSEVVAETSASESAEQTPLTRQQLFSALVILAWIVAVLVFKVNLGLSAFLAATLIVMTGAADENQSIRKVPWGVILMVSGVALLISILEKTGGMDQFTALLARVARPWSINGLIAMITGAISTYSSTSGVVLPTFLPMAPKLVQQIGGGDSLAVALSINVGSSIVDVSPLSTLGALCIATISDPGESKKLFRQMMIWGMTMIVVGGVFCYLFSGIIARW